MGNIAPTTLSSVDKLKLKAKLFQDKILKKSRSSNTDEFIIKYNQSNANRINDLSLLDQRRVIFISLIGLFETWNVIPSIVLHSSIFILPLSRKWVMHPGKYEKQIKNNFVSNYHIFWQNVSESREFIELLKYKDSQGLVFWMLDDYVVKDTKIQINILINPFWYHLSNQLEKLFDPINNDHYKPLQTKRNWWRSTYNLTPNHISKTGIKESAVLDELYSLTMKYKSIEEIIHQSNAKSFIILKRYASSFNACPARMIKVGSNSILDMFDTKNSNNKTIECQNTEWFISENYDPYLDVDCETD